MDVKELFKGIAVVIDDEIRDSDSSIYNILNQLKTESIPYVEYDSLPDERIIENLHNVSFVLLDWKLNDSLSKDDISEGVKLPNELSQTNEASNIEFLKKIQENCFCPIFIFTDENIDDIILKLKRERLYRNNSCNAILIKSKSEFKESGTLFSNLERWLKETAPIYLLKEWDYSYQKSKSSLFIDFQKRSADWVKILWQTYKGDNVNPCVELESFISRSIITQMMPLELDNSIFVNSSSDIDRTELVSCLERQCYVQNNFLDSTMPETGDIFEISNDFYVNIRPSCDLISRDGTPLDDIDLYLLKAEKIRKLQSIKEYFNDKYGHFEENDTYYLVYPICSGYLLKLKFRELRQEKWRNIKFSRNGRLLPPYITKLQMKYSAYLQRQGFPKIPNELFGLEAEPSEENT